MDAREEIAKKEFKDLKEKGHYELSDNKSEDYWIDGYIHASDKLKERIKELESQLKEADSKAVELEEQVQKLKEENDYLKAFKDMYRA